MRMISAIFAVCLFLASSYVAAQQSSGESPTPLEDSVAPLVPARARNEREKDHVDALALFAAGRIAQQRQDDAGALRLYECALREDPGSLPILREIVPLAFGLNRHAEAVRYALMAVERDPSDAILLRRLGIYLTEEGEWERALKLYEQALSIEEKKKPSVDLVFLRMEMGRLYYLSKSFDAAAQQFSAVLAALDRPDEHGLDGPATKQILANPELTYYLIGDSFLQAGRLDEATSAFEKSNGAQANPSLLAFNLARVGAARKQPGEAIAKLGMYFAARQSDQGLAPYQLLAHSLGELGQAGDLIGQLENLYAADPDNIPLGYFLAQQYRQDKRLDKALAVFEQLMEKHRDHLPMELYMGMVQIYVQQHSAEKLLTVLGQAVAKTGSLSALGEPAKALTSDAELVNAMIERARAVQPAETGKADGVQLAVALVALANKQFALGEEFFDRALMANPHKKAELLLSWGLELFMADRYADAASAFQRGIDESALPADNPAFYFYLAGALEMEGKTDEAIAAARKAAEIQPASARFMSRIAWVMYHAKRYDEAARNYVEFIERFDKSYDSTEAREVLRDARLVLSNISVLKEDLPRAEEWLAQVLDEFPEDVGAMNDLGYLWIDQGKHLERGLVMIQKAVGAEPKNMAYRDSLGWALFRLGRIEEAVAELKAAVTAPEPDGVVLDHLGDALSKNGDLAGAQQAWSRAQAIFEKEDDAEKARSVREKLGHVQSRHEK